MKCGQENSWATWSAREVTLGDMAKNYGADQEKIADPSRRIVSGVVLAASGYPIPVHVGCKLEFDSDQVIILCLFEGGQFKPIAREEYPQVLSLQIGGRGAITTGGGWVGGGFGLTGIVTGALLASALNKATTRTNIETVLHFRSKTGELFLLNTQYTPQQLSMMVSPVITRIETAHDAVSLPAPPARDPVEQLRELSELRANGSISEEEFQSLKANIMKSLA